MALMIVLGLILCAVHSEIQILSYCCVLIEEDPLSRPRVEAAERSNTKFAEQAVAPNRSTGPLLDAESTLRGSED